MLLQHYATEAEQIWTGDVSNMTFTAAFKMCSCNYFCAAFKCQFVHLDPVQVFYYFPVTRFLILEEKCAHDKK